MGDAVQINPTILMTTIFQVPVVITIEKVSNVDFAIPA